MNANEIADALDEYNSDGMPVRSVGLASAMLRQQAEEIIELECEKERQREKYEGMLCDRDVEIEALKAGKIRAYDNGVEDGKKHNTNNEPVAYINKEDGLVCAKCYKPFRTLTDEEIANTWDDVRKDATLKSSMKDIQDFARAILRKAQEK
jgi:hypothetical protein